MATVSADCYLLAEPAVSAQLNNGYSIVGDLQALYGVGGFPQAVLVAKKSLIQNQTETVKKFLTSVKESCEKLTSLTGATLVQTVTAHLEDSSYATTLKAPLLTETTLLRCGVRYDGDPKEKVLAYLTSAKAVQSAITVPNDSFFWSANN
jgi:ABC-type nitrate/sulfonate/bicarbonate transport system substrate-binding protein